MYMNSNDPYYRVAESNNGSSFLGGAMMGGALAGATHYASSATGQKHLSTIADKGFNIMADRAIAKHDKVRNNPNATAEQRIAADNRFNRSGDRIDRNAKDVNKGIKAIGNQNSRMFGSGVRGALTYGGSVLAGGIIGSMME